MKILHTGDLHLGKRLGSSLRLDEQREVLREIARIADDNDVDCILIAGDVFDSSIPPSEAERVLYKGLLGLSRSGRAVIALAGNHDDKARLCAAKPLADHYGIILAGDLDYSDIHSDDFIDDAPPASLFVMADAVDFLAKQRLKVVGKFGGITLEKGEEKVNIALVPYPTESRLSDWLEQDYSLSYPDRIKQTLEKACEFFDDNYNILCTHLFISKIPNEMLGGAVALTPDVFPEKCDYVALGHVHKHMRVCKKPLAEYSGSPLQYAYDETRDKSVNLVDTKAHTVKAVPLSSGRKLTEVTADNFEECIARLDAHQGDYVRLLYGGDPLGKDEAAQIKAHPAFNDLIVTAQTATREKAEKRAHLSDDVIFTMYYNYRYGKDPSPELRAAFVGLMNGLSSEQKGEE